MTTIAYRDGIMACDSCWSYDDGLDTSQTKIRRLVSGALLGSAGDNDSRELEHLFDKVRTRGQLPTKAALLALRCDYLGILVLPGGAVFKVGATHVSEANWDKGFSEDIGIWEINAPFTTVGTGSRWATGAMAAGKSAREAVQIACRYDLNSRPPIYVVPLKAPEKDSKKPASGVEHAPHAQKRSSQKPKGR